MLSKHRHDGAWTLQDYRLPKGCWLHVLHIIILAISYTQLALGFRLVCFVFWETLKCIWFCCSNSIAFWLKYCKFGSDHPRDLLYNQNQNLIWNFSPFLDVQMHIQLDTPPLVCMCIVSAAIRGEKWQRYPISWHWWYKSLWLCSRQHSTGSCVSQQSFSTG